MLSQLDVSKILLLFPCRYYQHSVDRDVPLEDTWRELKVKFLRTGLSSCETGAYLMEGWDTMAVCFTVTPMWAYLIEDDSWPCRYQRIFCTHEYLMQPVKLCHRLLFPAETSGAWSCEVPWNFRGNSRRDSEVKNSNCLDAFESRKQGFDFHL